MECPSHDTEPVSSIRPSPNFSPTQPFLWTSVKSLSLPPHLKLILNMFNGVDFSRGLSGTGGQQRIWQQLLHHPCPFPGLNHFPSCLSLTQFCLCILPSFCPPLIQEHHLTAGGILTTDSPQGYFNYGTETHAGLLTGTLSSGCHKMPYGASATAFFLAVHDTGP